MYSIGPVSNHAKQHQNNWNWTCTWKAASNKNNANVDCCRRIHVSSMVSSENLVLDSRAKPSRYNHAFSGTYYIHISHTVVLKIAPSRTLFVPPCLFPLPVCIFICVLLFVWAASLMSVCFSGRLLSASIHCIHCNISIAQKINFDWLIDTELFTLVSQHDRSYCSIRWSLYSHLWFWKFVLRK